MVEKIFCSLCLQGASFIRFAPGPPKALGGSDAYKGISIEESFLGRFPLGNIINLIYFRFLMQKNDVISQSYKIVDNSKRKRVSKLSAPIHIYRWMFSLQIAFQKKCFVLWVQSAKSDIKRSRSIAVGCIKRMNYNPVAAKSHYLNHTCIYCFATFVLVHLIIIWRF